MFCALLRASRKMIVLQLCYRKKLYVLSGIFLTVFISIHAFAFRRVRYPVPSWVFNKPGNGSCQPKKNIAFLKTHKCASSAIQNILFRYGRARELNVAVPPVGSYYGGPVPFQTSMLKLDPWEKDINIFALHTKWNREEIAKAMPEDSIFFTIVREPSALFESLFVYTKLSEISTLDDYVANYQETIPRIQGFLGYNQMTWDFGIEPDDISNISAVKELIKKSDNHFDLVLLAEKMEESLILLRHLLCWPVEDVVVLKINARNEEFKNKLSEKTRELLQQRLQSDYLIYNHFRDKFDQLVEAFGKERMEKEVYSLRRMTSNIYNKCGFVKQEQKFLTGNAKPWSKMVSGYKNHRLQDERCQGLSMSELNFIELLKRQQQRRWLEKQPEEERMRHVQQALGAVPLYKNSLSENAVRLKKTLRHS